MKSINSIQKYPYVIESINICFKIFVLNQFFNFFWIHFQHLHTNQSNESLLIHTHRYLQYIDIILNFITI